MTHMIAVPGKDRAAVRHDWFQGNASYRFVPQLPFRAALEILRRHSCWAGVFATPMLPLEAEIPLVIALT
jgi:hypothetical protein